MNFREWRQWVRELPLSLKWFVYLVLIRSSLDPFYSLKTVSPFLSPLYIVGVLTPVLIVASFFSRALRRRNESSLNLVISIWGMLLLFNTLLLVLSNQRVDTLGIAVKMPLVVLLFIYLRYLIRSKRDLLGLLTTFLYTSAVPFAMTLYERFVSPLGDVVQSRGYVRYEGFYADVVDYSLYVIGAFLIVCYFFLERGSSFTLKGRSYLLTGIGALTVLALINLHHIASWGVFFALLGLFVYQSTQSTKQFTTVALILFMCVIGLFFVGDTFSDRFSALFAKDVAIIEGEKPSEEALQGRWGRWTRAVGVWKDLPPHAMLFGVYFSTTPPPAHPFSWWASAAVHNDYLRVLFATGIIGLLVYGSFYVILFFRSKRMAKSDKYLVWGAMAIMLMFSISTTPTLYAPLTYLTMAVFAYAALPQFDRQRIVPVSRIRYPRPRAVSRVSA